MSYQQSTLVRNQQLVSLQMIQISADMSSQANSFMHMDSSTLCSASQILIAALRRVLDEAESALHSWWQEPQDHRCRWSTGGEAYWLDEQLLGRR